MSDQAKGSPKSEASKLLPVDICEISIKVGDNVFQAKGDKLELRVVATQFIVSALTPNLQQSQQIMANVTEYVRKCADGHQKTLNFLAQMDALIKKAEERGLPVFDDKATGKANPRRQGGQK